ncbi:Beta-mannosidase [Strongyloides ratti]|uniref:beta-mannosidase n=1 Tax=Strongyloides ratti TaxID=34506 RepID=A0A090MXU1_STRRB|nr:Beta-mannosidase [Strongyloides ratti]CEF66024.1 Beta-mannosidase [Strongyloides ratti]
MKTLLLLYLCLKLSISKQILNLSSSNEIKWQFESSDGNYKGDAIIPGHIFGDLERLSIIPNTLYSINYIKNQWVSYKTWIFTTKFDVDKNLLKSFYQKLYLNEIDTIADVFMNNILISNLANQHKKNVINLLSNTFQTILKEKNNNLTIVFYSNPKYGEKAFNDYKNIHEIILYPESQPSIIKGLNHVNFIRKNQASFGWDWGPSIDSVGIKKDIFIIFGEEQDNIIIENLFSTINSYDNYFIINVKANIWGNKIKNKKVSFTLPEIGLKNEVLIKNSEQTEVNTTFKVLKKNVKLWWPVNYGNQSLYTLYASTENLIQQKIRIAFRSVKLNQDFIDEKNFKKGRNFYFIINDIPIFLKGTNYIPINITDTGDGNQNWERKKYLLKSLIKSNMNSLRIWGGGTYETDKFYDLADELGILIWHDLMFACALYPIDENFIKNVNEEIRQQILRLSHHPSIIIWAGNNENEIGLRKWWNTNKKHYEEYKIFYINNIKKIVTSIDSSRPFVISSPSNGIKTEEDDGISLNPMSELYGDIHYYNDFSNLWNTSTFLIPRCSTEYGIQSYPDPETMKRYLGMDYKPFNNKLLSRQHHNLGEIALQALILGHFKINFNYTYNDYLPRFTYLTQVHQAIAIEKQSLHYRSWRSKINSEGKGHTMCAMFWQLNDVWAAPSWSSIDFNLKWKPLMYHAKRFFNDIVIFLDVKNNNLLINIINDKNYDIYNATIKIYTYAWESNLNPIYIEKIKISKISKLSSTDIKYPQRINRIEEYFISSIIVSEKEEELSPISYLYPDKFFNVPFINNTLEIEEVTKVDKNNYEIILKCQNIIPLVWIDLSEEIKRTNPDIIYEFNDNSFSMVTFKKILKLKIVSNSYNIKLSKSDLIVCFLDTCGFSS